MKKMTVKISIDELRGAVKFLQNAPIARKNVFGVPTWEFLVQHAGNEQILQIVGQQLYDQLQDFAPIAARTFVIQKPEQQGATNYHVRPVRK